MSDVEIVVARDFTLYPSGRYASDGPWSGEIFRKKHLGPALLDNDIVTVVLDGVMGYGSSFLEEAFGGLVRDGLIRSMSEFDEKIVLVSESTALITEIREYIQDEINRTTH